MVQNGRGSHPALQRGGEDDRLERRARLTPRLGRANVARRAEVASADQRPDLARHRVERDETAFEIARCLARLHDLGDAVGDRLLRRALHLGVVAGVDAQAALQHFLAAEAGDELAANLFLEVAAARRARRDHRRGGRRRAERKVDRRLVFGLGDTTGVAHQAQHEVTAREGALRVVVRRIAARRAHQAGEQRRLVRLQVGGRLAEVAARRRFDAVVAVAEIHGVQIGVEDFLLGIAFFEADRDRRFPDLAREGPIRRQLLEARELLRQGATPLDDAAAMPVAPGGFDDTRGVETMVRKEAAVLDGEERIDHAGRHAVERHVDALFHIEREDLAVLAIEDDRGLGMRANLGNRRRMVELVRHAPRGPKRDHAERPDHHRAHHHARDQQYSSHACCKRNPGASKNYQWINGLRGS